MKNLSTTIIILLIVGGGAFYGGMKYQESKSVRSNISGRTAGLGRNGSRPTTGEIIKSDDKSMTVKLQDGSSKIILFSDKTSINKAAEGSKADLKTGVRVAVFGTQNSDGSVTAQNIQLNPMVRGANR